MESGSDSYGRSVSAIGRGTAVMAVSTTLLLAFNFIGRVAVARSFSLTAWGEFNLGLALVGFLSLTALLGLNQALARSLSFETDPAERRALVVWALGIAIVASAVLSSLVYLLAQPIADLFHDPAFALVVRLFSVTIAFTVLSMMLASIFQGFEDATPNAWFNGVISPGLFVAFVVLVLYLHVGFTGALVAYAGSQGVTLAVLVGYTLRRLPALIPPSDRKVARPKPQLFELSVSLWGVTSLAFVTAYIDTLILGAFRSTADVGLYSAAMTLARLLLVGNGALTYIFLPVTARLAREKDMATLRRTFVTSTRWTLAITVPMFLLFAFLPTASLAEVFGAAYSPAGVSLEILVIGSFISVVMGPVNACLGGLGLARTLLMTTAVSATANIALSFTLIPLFGSNGAAVAWAVARILYPGLGLYALWRTERITPFRRILVRPLAVALAVGIPLFAAAEFLSLRHWVVFVLYFVGVAIFLASILLTRSLDSGDLLAANLLERVVRRPLPGLRRFLERFIAPTTWSA